MHSVFFPNYSSVVEIKRKKDTAVVSWSQGIYYLESTMTRVPRNIGEAGRRGEAGGEIPAV